MECKISFQCIENQDKLTKLQQQIADYEKALESGLSTNIYIINGIALEGQEVLAKYRGQNE